MNGKVLIVDGDKEALHSASQAIERSGYEVFTASDGKGCLRLAYQHQPDLIILEVDLPAADGWEVCKRLREMSDVPIMFLTCKRSDSDIVEGLDIGADDYVIKPCEPAVLLARMRARLRRTTRTNLKSELYFRDGAFQVNFLNREVWVDGEHKHLTPKEFSLLAVLVRNAGRVVTRDELVTEAWGQEYGDAMDSLKLYIHYLRKKLERDAQNPQYIVTSRGIGYRFKDN